MVKFYGYPPAQMRRDEAARFLTMSPAKFQAMVNDGRLPPPRKVDTMSVWLTSELQEAVLRLHEIDEEGGPNEWDVAS
jgi:predicted DNA-binding transcriptional regulator AlpA